MRNPTAGLQRLQAKAEASNIKTALLQQALAQLEASLSRRESQTVIEKSRKR